MDHIETVVIGAGVVGLAIARALAQAGHEAVVLEAADAIGTGTSSRSSEVIHAGMYYATGSLKARLCVAGRKRLYDYVASHGVGHRRIEKLIVASGDKEVVELRHVFDRGHANGVDDLVWLEGPEALRLEPELRADAAILSPSTGIIDSHGLMLSYQGDIEDAGGVIALSSPVTAGRVENGHLVLGVGGADPTEIACHRLVNAAGLGAQAVARAITAIPPKTIPPRYMAKGQYFSLSGPSPFQRLIYPVPNSASLGIHFTRDLSGRGRFGPDVQWIETENYDVDTARIGVFADAIRPYWPGVRVEALHPDYAGIRPKIQAPGDPAKDWLFQGPDVHGVPGLINLYGMESPGLTSSLAIADAVVERLA